LRTGTSFILEKPISQSKTQIAQKLFALEDKGATALGPALLASVGVAAQKPGSKVILCTDGLANIGLGSMDTDDGANEEEAEAFYRRVAAYAKDNGVIINVISIKGTTCSMENLGILADTTGGQVDIVDPLELTKKFPLNFSDSSDRAACAGASHAPQGSILPRRRRYHCGKCRGEGHWQRHG
jgi:hypothetical protein